MAERAVLEAFGSGCSLPVSAYATVEGSKLTLAAALYDPMGKSRKLASAGGDLSRAREIGFQVAAALKQSDEYVALAGRESDVFSE